MSIAVFDPEALMRRVRAAAKAPEPAKTANPLRSEHEVSRLAEIADLPCSVRWLPELKALIPTLAAAVNDSERRCFICGQPARFGFEVHLRSGSDGRWTCAAHRPQGEGRA